MEDRGDINELSTRLAMARLRHQVDELQSQVENDRKLAPPTRKVYHCVADDSAFTVGIAEIKRWVVDGAVEITVPLATLDGLDMAKKGTDPLNVNARETIRYFDRIQSGSLAVRGINFQTPTEAFESFKDCEKYMIEGAILPGQQKSPVLQTVTPQGSPSNKATEIGSLSPPRSAGLRNGNGFPGSPGGKTGNYGNARDTKRSNTFPQNNPRYTETVKSAPIEPPRRIQQLINCVLYRKHVLGKRDSAPLGHQQLAKQQQRPEVHLVTNNPEVAAWARVYDIAVLGGNQLEDMVEREDFIYNSKMKEYQDSQVDSRSGGGGGGRGGRGRGGRGGGGNGRNGHLHINGNGAAGGRGGRGAEPDFVFVREAPRGVARGKGKLWEP
ncbi:hypothetical protein DFH27DRAFT_229444 [Peziza echinospora]|nr:hypothetical protein DFH27DRAFT_229444 [Peziza echinospora]